MPHPWVWLPKIEDILHEEERIRHCRVIPVILASLDNQNGEARIRVTESRGYDAAGRSTCTASKL
jgi:hypothetical protein